MKPLLNLIHSIWVVTVLAVFGLPRIASASSPVPMLSTHDGPNQARIAYDGRSPSVFNYDSAAVLSADGKESQTARTGGIFGISAELFAAKGAANIGATLPEREIANFIGRPAQVRIGEGEVLYGIRDAGSRNIWWTRNQPAGELQWRMDQAVLPKWNQATRIETLTVPRGQSLIGFEGPARGQSWYLGGGNQVYIPNVPSGWSTMQPWR